MTAHADYLRARYKRDRQRGVCVRCGAPCSGALCAKHRAEQNEAKRDRTPAQAEDFRVYLRARYWSRRNAGLCTRCGKPSPGALCAEHAKSQGRNRGARCSPSDSASSPKHAGEGESGPPGVDGAAVRGARPAGRVKPSAGKGARGA